MKIILKTLRPHEVAHLYGRTVQSIQSALISGVDWGCAYQNRGSTTWNYDVYPYEFAKHLGLTVQELAEELAKSKKE